MAIPKGTFHWHRGDRLLGTDPAIMRRHLSDRSDRLHRCPSGVGGAQGDDVGHPARRQAGSEAMVLALQTIRHDGAEGSRLGPRLVDQLQGDLRFGAEGEIGLAGGNPPFGGVWLHAQRVIDALVPHRLLTETTPFSILPRLPRY